MQILRSPVTGLDLHFLSPKGKKIIVWFPSSRKPATPHRGVAFKWVRVRFPWIPKYARPLWGRAYFGAGNRTRTGTLFTARDFKSLVSTYFTIPAW